ncbi:MAG: hypothetical protein IT332_12170 [Ardenticatenales bacterium]|nr:hypothetical protein [Ardenticatenales bacterium]
MQRPHPWLLVLAMAVAVGCSAPAAAPTTDEPATGAQAPVSTDSPVDAAVSALPTAGDIAAPAEPATAEQQAQPARDPNRDFTPSDPAAVTLAAGRPQLVEFFAHW